MSAVDDLIKALGALNGKGHLDEIYEQCRLINSKAVDSTIRRTLQQYSSDSVIFINKGDYFFSVKGIGFGDWGLRNYYIQTAEVESFIEESLNEETFLGVSRRLITNNRIIRDTALSRTVKEFVGNKCQLCDTNIVLHNGSCYTEAHHIRPLGVPHNGPDSKSNIIVLCPNCHVCCDFNTIELSLEKIHRNLQGVSQMYIDYHNAEYKRKKRD
jgi:hypothetical protein